MNIHRNFHFSVTALVIALCVCLSERINFSLTKQRRQTVSGNIQCQPVSNHYNTTTALVLGMRCSSGSLLDTWVGGLLGDCIKFLNNVTHSPIHRQTGAPIINIHLTPVCTALDFCKTLYCQYCLVALEFIHTFYVVRYVCIYIYIYMYVYVYVCTCMYMYMYVCICCVCVYIYIYIFMYIQGVTGGTDQTSGGCSLC